MQSINTKLLRDTPGRGCRRHAGRILSSCRISRHWTTRCEVLSSWIDEVATVTVTVTVTATATATVTPSVAKCIIARVNDQGENCRGGGWTPQLCYQPPQLMLREVPQGGRAYPPPTMTNVNKCMG